ncbi:MAG: hypothetical protein PHS49_07715 [Candidatus Gracilibacteria bacterium]|nr:hypothetical protein [Candidatus Gracilibacteria bacterium]
MPIKNTKKDHPDSSTQRYLPFSQIRENVAIMKDDSARIIMRCSTINFLLKNTDEQDSIIISFQRFLNSLDFPIQILVRSKKLDIDTYLSNLNDKAIKQQNPLLQNQTYEYIEYLRKLIEVAQIMKKEFYIVLPYDETENKSVKDSSLAGIFRNFWLSINGGQDLLRVRSQIRNFSKMKKGLIARSNSIKTGLENVGLKAEILTKQEVVSFFTEYYNPSLDSLIKMGKDPTQYNLTNN